MDIAQTRTDLVGPTAQEWIADLDRSYPGRSITLDGDLMIAAFADGVVPDGVTLGRVTATGRYGPYDDAAVDGREVMDGHLLTQKKVRAGVNIGASLMWTGLVNRRFLPANHGLDPAGEADVDGRITYIDTAA